MITMKGSLLKKFLNACELRGILHLNVDSSLSVPELEEKVSCKDGILSNPSGLKSIFIPPARGSMEEPIICW